MGMRNGLILEARDGTRNVVYDGKTHTIQMWPRNEMSFLTLAVLAKDQPLYLMTASEIWLLRAEAALYDLGPASLNGTVEQKFETICNQMWVSFVPNYIESWNNMRRTGYPKIPQRTAPDLSKGATDGYLPKRLRYPQTTERNINGVNMQKAIDRMGGDEIDIAVWWDVKD